MYARISGFLLWCLLALGPLFPAWAATPHAWTTPGMDGGLQVHLYFFWSQRCPHCLEARPRVEALAAAHPWIVPHLLEVSQDRENLERYVSMAADLGEQASSVPAFLYCGRMQVGWDGDASESQLLAGLRACRDDPTLAGKSWEGRSPDTTLRLPFLGELEATRLSLPVLTVLIAAMDAFNPCAFFVLLFLLSLLVHQKARWRMLVIGGVFVLCSGLLYFAFMAAWLGVFRVAGGLPWITAAAGAAAAIMGAVNVKDFFAFKAGVTLSIPESRKADIFRRGRDILALGSLPAMLAATVLLALAANFYELLCTAGFPMIYTRVLTMQVASPARHLLYLAAYSVIYVLPLLAIVLVFVRTLGSRKLSEREGRLLKLLSGLMMLGLGVLLLTAPEWLGNIAAALGLMAAAAALTWLAARLTRPD